MEYLDLNKLEVRGITEFTNIRECRISISDDDLDMPLSQFHNKLTNELQPLFKQLKDDIPTLFNIVLDCEYLSYDDIETLTDDFVSFSEQITSIIFSHLVDSTQPRQREFRLDVPTNLKQEVFMPLHWLKNAINYRTKINKFNIVIRGYFQDDTYLKFYLVNSISKEGIEVCEN